VTRSLLLSRALLAGLATAVLVLATSQLTPRPGEPLPVRWGRTAARHPLRTTLALTLLALGLRRPAQEAASVEAAALPRVEAREELG
jgi:hypothetical protein